MLLALALLNLQAVAAGGPAAPPADLVGVYDAESGTAYISWSAPGPGRLEYSVYRDGELLGTTTATNFADADVPVEPGWIYVVTAASPGSPASDPAVLALAVPSCEIVNVSTSWDYPYLHARLHEECLGGTTFQKDVTWAAET